MQSSFPHTSISLTQISKRLSAQHRRQLRMGESDLTDLDPDHDVEEGLSAQHLRMGESDVADLDPSGSEEVMSSQKRYNR